MAVYYSYELNYETFQATVIYSIGKSKISYYYFSEQGSVLILIAFPHLQLMVHPTQAWHTPVTGVFRLLSWSSQYSFRLHTPWKISCLCGNKQTRDKQSIGNQRERKWRGGMSTTSDEGGTQGHGPFSLGSATSEQNPHRHRGTRLQGLRGMDTSCSINCGLQGACWWPLTCSFLATRILTSNASLFQ